MYQEPAIRNMIQSLEMCAMHSTLIQLIDKIPNFDKYINKSYYGKQISYMEQFSWYNKNNNTIQENIFIYAYISYLIQYSLQSTTLDEIYTPLFSPILCIPLSQYIRNTNISNSRTISNYIQPLLTSFNIFIILRQILLQNIKLLEQWYNIFINEKILFIPKSITSRLQNYRTMVTQIETYIPEITSVSTVEVITPTNYKTIQKTQPNINVTTSTTTYIYNLQKELNDVANKHPWSIPPFWYENTIL